MVGRSTGCVSHDISGNDHTDRTAGARGAVGDARDIGGVVGVGGGSRDHGRARRIGCHSR